MYRLPQDFYNKVIAGEQPTVYIVVQTQMGYRAYSGKTLGDFLDSTTMFLDGSWFLDGSVTLGINDFYASKEPLVLNYDRLQKTLSQKSKNLLSGFSSKRQNSLSIELNNADRKLTELMAKEPFITRPLTIYVGFDTSHDALLILEQEGFLELEQGGLLALEDGGLNEDTKIYSGVIDEINITLATVKLTAVED